MRVPHRPLALLAFASLLLAGCAAPPLPDPGPTMPAPPPPGTPPPETPPPGPSPSFNATAEGFSWDLFRALHAADPQKNLFFSPASVAAAFCLALEGAAGTTREAIAETLGLSDTPEEDCRALTQALLRARNASAAEVDVANSVWLREGFAPSVKPAFLDALQQDFRAGAFVRPFTPATVVELNEWVSNATRGRVTDILDEIPDDLVFMLVNAIHFKGRWTKPFDPAVTSPGPFRLSEGGTVQVPMLRNESALNVSLADGDGFRAARLPYGDGSHAMYLLLPDEGRGLDAITTFTDATWSSLRNATEPQREVDLSLPKFRLEWDAELKDLLAAMGMEVAFDPDAGDFGRIADVAPERLYLSFVKHKAVVEVDEEGTTAAAATVVGGSVTSLPPPPPEFHVDRPFGFAIVDERLGLPLFLGKITDPRAG